MNFSVSSRHGLFLIAAAVCCDVMCMGGCMAQHPLVCALGSLLAVPRCLEASRNCQQTAQCMELGSITYTASQAIKASVMLRLVR